MPGKTDELESKPSFQRFARAGLSGRAIIYLVLAYLAADIAATGGAPVAASGEGALSEVARQPAGRPLLGLLALALAGYSLWRLAQAVARSSAANERFGLAKRAGWAVAGVVYAVLCERAVSLALAGSGGGGGASSHPQPWVATVLRWPAGAAWAALAGAGLVVGGGALLAWGLVHDHSKTLARARPSRAKARLGRAMGAIGEATRGSLVLLVAAYLLAAAADDDPSQAKSLGQALASLRRATGPWALALAAAGLAAFAIFSFAEALYRDI